MGIWQIFCIVVTIVLIVSIVVVVVFLLKYLEKRERECGERIKLFQDRNNSLRNKLDETEKELDKAKETLIAKERAFAAEIQEMGKMYKKLENEFQRINRRYQVAENIFPNMERAINDEIVRERKEKEVEEAKRVERVIKVAIDKEVNLDTMDEIFSAMDSYQNLVPYQKTFVEADITVLNEKYREAVELGRELELKRQEEENKKRAKVVEEKVKADIMGINRGRACYYYTLKRARALYDGLSDESKCYFDKSVYDRLSVLFYEANNDLTRKMKKQKS